MATELPQDEVQRWTAKRRVALVLSSLKGETSRPRTPANLVRPAP